MFVGVASIMNLTSIKIDAWKTIKKSGSKQTEESILKVIWVSTYLGIYLQHAPPSIIQNNLENNENGCV